MNKIRNSAEYRNEIRYLNFFIMSRDAINHDHLYEHLKRCYVLRDYALFGSFPTKPKLPVFHKQEVVCCVVWCGCKAGIVTCNCPLWCHLCFCQPGWWRRGLEHRLTKCKIHPSRCQVSVSRITSTWIADLGLIQMGATTGHQHGQFYLDNAVGWSS